MKNSEYWKKRFDIIEAAKNKAGERAIADVEDIFNAAQRELESQIQTWYGRFAKNNQISLAEAKRLLKTNELAEFRWDVKEYIKYGEQVGLNPAWMKQLENASARFHVSRLEALQLQTQQTMEKLFGNQLDNVDHLLKHQYLDGYYHTFYEVQRGFNIGWDIAAVNDGRLEKIISKPWTPDKQTFSDRIWTDKNKLLNQVHTELTRNMILGKSPDAAINNLAKAMGTSKQNAGRLIMTESAYFSNLAQRDAFNELDVEQFEIVETLDSITCPICGGMDGKVFPMKDFQAGVTAPPFHPWCRGCIVPYFADDFGERAARDSDGKTYYVPSDMKFKEWKEKYVVENTGISGDTKGLADDKYTYNIPTENGTEKDRAKMLKNQVDSSIINISGGGMINTGASGAIPREDMKRQNQHAKLFYEEVRKRNGDISAVAKNTGFSIEDVKKIKNHMFFNKYDLGYDKPSCFDPDYDISVSWQRLTEGKAIQEMDIVLLNHELMEYGLMSEKGLSYREAHEITEKIYDYAKYVRELNEKEGVR